MADTEERRWEDHQKAVLAFIGEEDLKRQRDLREGLYCLDQLNLLECGGVCPEDAKIVINLYLRIQANKGFPEELTM